VEPTVTRLKVEQIGEEASGSIVRPDEAWLERLGLGADVRVAPSLAIDLEMYRVGEEVFVSGRLRGTLQLPCSRCLEPAQAEVDQPFRAVYLRAAGGAEGLEIEPGAPSESLGHAAEAESPDVFCHARGWLDLTPMLREQILLAFPARALCGEECLGLCPACGANLNRARCDCTPQTGISKFEKLRGLLQE
jgi:uncharacterized protein